MSKELQGFVSKLESLAPAHEAIPIVKELLQKVLRPETEFQFFLDCVDESNHSFSEWMDAILVFVQFNDGIDFQFRTMIGYITCSAEAAQTSLIHFTLSDLVRDFLEQYGFENGTHE